MHIFKSLSIWTLYICAKWQINGFCVPIFQNIRVGDLLILFLQSLEKNKHKSTSWGSIFLEMKITDVAMVTKDNLFVIS